MFRYSISFRWNHTLVMAGLVPAIHVFVLPGT